MKSMYVIKAMLEKSNNTNLLNVVLTLTFSLGEKLSLDGMHTKAVDAWKKEIEHLTGVYWNKHQTSTTELAI